MATNAHVRSRPKRIVLGIATVVLVAGGFIAWRAFLPVSAPAATTPQGTPATVTTVKASARDVPVYRESLGTVQAVNTVAIHSQIDGRLQSVNFVEGQEVHKGDVLVEIDPRAYQAALDQAVAKKAEDQAQLVSAQKDLDRFKPLVARGAATQQNLDQQTAKVDQLKATVDADQASIESAETQLSYTKIVAPIDGRAGFRQIDAGNIIHASDQNPVTVLTQIRPSEVVFTLPQKDLADVREAMLRGPVPVIAYDQDNVRQLARGQLLLVDNQIDQTTSTIRLKATFPNDDTRLWPGEFVKLRLLIDTEKNALTIPSAALQRGPDGFFTWVVRGDNTAEQRPVDVKLVQDNVVALKSGLAAGDRVVLRGQYRLQSGTHVEERPAASAQAGERAS